MKLIETIETFISGDWGNESHTEDTPCEVFCVRGADIEPIKNQDYNHIPKRYISKRSYENKLLQVGDIIVEKSGGSPTQSTGRVCLITPNLIEKLQSVDCSNFCAAFRVKKEWDAEYIYLYIQHFYNMGAFFNFEGKTSGIKNLQLEQAYQAIEIKPISIAEQKKLAKTIRTIDGKTAINRSINQNLEAMAKQLYDYWFVQFDFPNGEGKPYKSSGGKMVWNEKLKREIPQGWNNGMLIDIANITMGQSPDGSSYNEVGEGMLFYQGSTDFGMRFPSVRQYTTAPSRYAKRGDILMSVRAPVGSINIANNDCCIGRGLSAINSKLGSTTHLYYILNDLRIAFEQRNAAGTTFGSITKEDLYSLPIIIPSHEVIRAFDKICSPMFDRQMILGEEIDNLIKQRDGLLPLLMNGQVSVNSDLSKCISKIGIVALIRNYPNSLLKYWRLVIIYKCRITFSYNFSSHFASLPSPSQISSTSSDRLLPPRLVGDRPSGGRKWSLRHHWRRWRLEFRI